MQLPADFPGGSAERQVEIAAYLAARPEDAQRLEAYRAQKRELHVLFDPVLYEQPPQRLLKSARPRAVPQTPWYLQRLAAGIAIAVISGATGWGLRGGLPAGGDDAGRMAAAAPADRRTRSLTVIDWVAQIPSNQQSVQNVLID